MAATQKNTGSRLDFGSKLNMTTPQPGKEKKVSEEPVLTTEEIQEQEEAKRAEAEKKALAKAKREEEKRLAAEAREREELLKKEAEEKKSKENFYQKRTKKLQEAGKVTKNITLTKELHEKAEDTAQALGISLNQFISDCIERDLASNKEMYEQVRELRKKLGVKF